MNFPKVKINQNKKAIQSLNKVTVWPSRIINMKLLSNFCCKSPITHVRHYILIFCFLFSLQNLEALESLFIFLLQGWSFATLGLFHQSDGLCSFRRPGRGANLHTLHGPSDRRRTPSRSGQHQCLHETLQRICRRKRPGPTSRTVRMRIQTQDRW